LNRKAALTITKAERNDLQAILELQYLAYRSEAEISNLIEQSRRTIYTHASGTTVLLFWKIGQRINNDILQNKRADYGKKIVSNAIF